MVNEVSATTAVAATTTSTSSSAATTGDGNKGEKPLWQTILADVSSSSRSRQLPRRNVIVLGDEGSGKSTLVSRLQKKKFHAEDHPLGTGLEYSFVDVREDDSEDVVGRLGVYTLDGDENHTELLQFVVSESTLREIAFVICLDFSKPWLLMDSLEKWLAVIEKQTSSLDKSAELQALKAEAVEYFQRFGADDGDGDEEVDLGLIALEQGVLTTNVGVPIIIVLTKCDSMAMLRKDFELQGQHFDFIQMKIREVCMRYGAALIATARGESTNTDRLFRYLQHRLYGSQLKDQPDITRPETTFIPSAWDSGAKIDILREGFKSLNPNDAFSQAIKAPITPTSNVEVIEVQDEQEFLRQQQGRLGRAASSLVSSLTSQDKAPTKLTRGSEEKSGSMADFAAMLSGGKASQKSPTSTADTASKLGQSSAHALTPASSTSRKGSALSPSLASATPSSSTTQSRRTSRRPGDESAHGNGNSSLDANLANLIGSSPSPTSPSTATSDAARKGAPSLSVSTSAGHKATPTVPATPSPKSAAPQHDVLQNFFNSLLQSTPPKGDDKK